MGIKTKVIGDPQGWFVVEYDEAYPTDARIIGPEYTTREEAEENLPEHRG